MTLAALALLAALSLAFYGWGALFRRLAAMPDGRWPVTVVLGLGSAIAAGGLLNLAHLAVDWALWLLLLAGIGLAAWRLKADGRLPRIEKSAWLVITLVAVLVVFTAATQLPPSAYNHDDDFHKYFVHPMRMLATGSVASGSLSSMGSETLGATAFLDGFVLSLLPIDCINAIDAVFGLFLCLAVAATATGNRLAAALAVLAAFAIDPQTVNISALYLGAAGMMAAVALTAGEKEFTPIPPAPALGLIAAALIAMKPIFLLFAVLHIAMTATALAVSSRSVWRTVKWTAAAVGWALLFLAPWIAIHAPHYIAGWLSPQPALVPVVQKETVAVFGFGENSYGLRPIWYAGAMLTAVAAGLAAAWFRRSSDAGPRLLQAAAAAVVLAGSYFGLAAASPFLAGWYVSLRYFTPFAIGLIPVLLAVALPELPFKPALRRPAMIAVALIPVVLFAPRLWQRIDQAAEFGNILAFEETAKNPDYIAFIAEALAPYAQSQTRTLQNTVPAGDPIMARINTPFWLDFNRNPIQEVDSAGLASPWAKIPDDGYVMVQYDSIIATLPADDEKHLHAKGAHEWLIQAHLIRFIDKINRAENTRTLNDDGHTVVLLRTLPAAVE